MRSIYYAAPFFNQLEMEVMVTAQLMFEQFPHIKGFFPYQASKAEQDSIQAPASRRRVYLANEQALIHNSEMIAWLDRQQMDGKQVQLCKSETIRTGNGGPGYSETEKWIGNGKELKQPDLGTVWEMGFARARGKTIAGFTLLDEKSAKLNLMLTESIDIMLYGWDQLREYLSLPHQIDVTKYIREKCSFWRGDVE